MRSYIFICGINNNDWLVRYNRLNCIDVNFLKCASAFKKNGYTTYFVYYDMASSKLLRICKKKDAFFIININRYNFNAINTFVNTLGIVNENILLLSINDDLKELVGNFYNYINYDENYSDEQNINKIATACSIQLINETQELCYKLCKPFVNKTINISIGSGCNRCCSFCNIISKQVQYRSLDIISKEINYILKDNVNYFHIDNHFFSKRPQFIKKLCEIFKSHKNKYSFVWSCFIVPEFFVNHVNLLEEMYQSGMRKIIIGAENVSKSASKGLNIPDNSQNTFKIVQKALSCGIVAIDVNMIIGSPEETKETLRDKELFIDKLLDMSNGICDVRLYLYHHPKYQNYRNICQDVFTVATPILSKNDLLTWKQNIEHHVCKMQKSKIYKLDLKSRHSIYQLNEFGILTDVYIHSLSMSSLKLTCGAFKYFSYNVPDDLLMDYVPIFTGGAGILENGDIITGIDKCLAHDGVDSLKFSNEYQFLFNLFKDKETLRIIIEKLDGIIEKTKILSTLKSLENHHLLYYIKTL
ncbi:MAG: hypothetical protein Q4F69_04845 [Bacteroidia bacterium]|nr:hypothetical protein [Bacteroidia bacterium]